MATTDPEIESTPPQPTMGPLHPHGPPAPSPASGRGGASLLGVLAAIVVGMLAVVVVGLSGIGFLLLLILEDLPFAVPGILLFTMLICVPAALVVWGRGR